MIYAQQNGGTAFYRYDPTENTWTTLSPSPINSGNNGGAAYLDDKIYTSYTYNSMSGVYDIATDTWTTIPNPLSAFGAPGTGNITAVGDDLYLAVSNIFVRYDPVTGDATRLANPPNFQYGGGFQPWGGLEPLDGKVYGHEGNGGAGFAVYDIATDTWTALPDVPGSGNAAVLGSAIDPIGRYYYAYGGYGGNNFYQFDIDAGTWRTIQFPTSLDDGGMAYVSTPEFRGVYATYSESSTGFTRFVTNAGPTADNDTYRTAENTTLNVAAPGVLANDTDPDADQLSATLVDGPTSGTVTLNANGSFTYTPRAGFSGSASFTYKASDGAADSNVATVNITVEAAPAPDPDPDPKPQPKPNPNACTIVGTPGKDVLRGTPGRDVICGLGGDDVLSGMGGNDILRGGPGMDVLSGGAGNDLIYGGAGNDRMNGDAGNDRLLGEAGNDTMHGGAGNDVLFGGLGNDVMKGGPGRDTLNGGPGRNLLQQ